jgi:hypothetical protein
MIFIRSGFKIRIAHNSLKRSCISNIVFIWSPIGRISRALKLTLDRIVELILLIFFTSTCALTTISFQGSFVSNANNRFPASKPILAYYYGWYTPNAWYGGIGGPNSLAVADIPSIGLYDSQNITVIDTQIREALSAGINGFIASWWARQFY